jgi:amidase
MSAYDAIALASLVRKGEVTPLELVDAAIERIESVNGTLNAVVTPMFELARETAKSQLPDGPFKGVPFLLKDLQAAFKGVRMTAGSNYLKEFVPDHDSEIVARYKRAGLITIGKTNTPEFGILPTTEPRLFGPTRNPWDVSRTPGGSSGGSAAAVAAGIVPAAHANDGGGSIRIPASCCGVFGLKPTRGRNPLGPDFGDVFGGLVAEHAVTRSVRDSAALLDATSGMQAGDPYYAPPTPRPFLEEVGTPPGKLRIALLVSAPSGTNVDPDCIAAAQDAARLCADLGHEVEEGPTIRELSIKPEMLVDAFMTHWAAGNAWLIDSLSFAVGRKPVEGDLEPLTQILIAMGHRRTAPSYLLAVQILQVYSRRIAALFEKYDVLLTPTLAEPPPLLGSFDAPPDDPTFPLRRSGLFCPFTPLFNGTGQPAMSVPLYWNDAGLPIGSQFAGRFGDEATLFRLAAQLEEARPWSERRPPVSA